MLEQRLKELCEPQFRDVIVKYDNAILIIKNQLRIIPHFFVHFSMHDQSHSEKILQYIEALLGEANINKLSASDLLMLLLSGFSHDLGMALNQEEIDDKFSEDSFSEILKQNVDTKYQDLKEIVERLLKIPESYKDYQTKDSIKLYKDIVVVIENVFRKDHAQNSKIKILENAELRALLGDRCVKFLADICGLHDKDISSIMDLPKEENGLFCDYFHPRFVAALLCLGDLLDMDTDRFDSTMLKATSPLPLLSELHKQKHESITHYLVKDSCIEIKADCQSVQVYRIMREWLEWMKDACEFMLLNWDELIPDSSLLPPRIKQCDILINGNSKWTGYANSKLEIDAAKALKLLEGSNIYEGKEVFVRELLQNAIDASLIQLFVDAERIRSLTGDNDSAISFEGIIEYIESGKLKISDYDINGRFYYDVQDKSVKVEITDRGTGIGDSELSVIAGLRGKSEKLKNIISRIPRILRPAGAFGIGLQSVFQVADKIEFYTKTDSEAPKKITIEDPGRTGFIYVEEADDKLLRGTKVVVTLDAGKFDQTDIGRSDYDYQTTDKEELLLGWLYQKCSNTIQDIMPLFEARRQLTDYFNISITGPYGEEGNNKEIIKRKSILQNVNVNSDNNTLNEPGFQNILDDSFYIVSNNGHINKPIIKNNYGNIQYKKFDSEKECIFEAEITISEFKRNDDGTIELGKLEYPYRYKYRKSIWYRNSFVEDEVLRDSLGNESRLYEIIDYRINLFSDNADDVLNLDRRRIRSTYHKKVEDLLSFEIEQMCKDIVDSILEQEYKEERIDNYITAFLAYYISLIFDYKNNDVRTNLDLFLAKIKVNNFYGENGKEFSIPLLELSEKKFMFLKEINKESEVVLPDAFWKNYIEKTDDFDDKNRIFCLYNHKEIKKHIFDFWLEEEDLVERNNKIWFAFLATVKTGSIGNSATKRNDVFIYKDFLNVILNNFRVVNVCKDYEILATPLNEGIRDYFHRNRNKMIEVMLDKDIRLQLRQELCQNGFVKDAEKRFFGDIVNSACYKKNVEFICSYHLNTDGTSLNRETIEEKYKQFYRNLLKLLENERPKDYCKEIVRFVEDYKFYSRNLNDEISASWNNYAIFRYR